MTAFGPWRVGGLQYVDLPSDGMPISGTVWAGRWVLGLNNGGVVHSKDGVTWSEAVFPFGADKQIDSLANGQGRVLAASTTSRRIGSTMDLAAWMTQPTDTPSLGYMFPHRVRYHAGRFFVVGGTATQAYSSRDCVTWTGGQTGTGSNPTGTHTDIAWNGRRFVAVGKQGRVFVSFVPRDLNTWQYATLPGTTTGGGPHATCCAFGAGRFVVGSSNGNFYHSVDGLTWQTALAPSAWPPNPLNYPSIQDMTYAHGQFLAACSGGYTATSTDGRAWDAIRDEDQQYEWAKVILVRGLQVLRAGGYYAAGKYHAVLHLMTLNSWPEALPAPMQRTVSTTRMDTRLRRETQSGRIEVRRFGSGAPAQADVTFRCLGNQATALLTFHRDTCRNGTRWFTAPWLPLLGFPAHAARFFTPPQRAGHGDLYSDYTTTLLVRGVEEAL